MSDLGETFGLMRADRKSRHAEWWQRNTDALLKAGAGFCATSRECYCFRDPSKLPVDFYPSTGRWRVPGQPKTYRGGAQAFLAWYAKAGLPNRRGMERGVVEGVQRYAAEKAIRHLGHHAVIGMIVDATCDCGYILPSQCALRPDQHKEGCGYLGVFEA